MDHRPPPAPAYDVNLLRDTHQNLMPIESVVCLKGRIEAFIRGTTDKWSQTVAYLLLQDLRDEKQEVADVERQLYGLQQAWEMKRGRLQELFSLPFSIGAHVQWKHGEEIGMYIGPMLDERGYAKPEWAQVEFMGGDGKVERMILPATALMEVDS